MRNKIILYGICLLSFVSCSLSQTDRRQKAVELNNEALQLYHESQGDPNVVPRVIELYDRSIRTDSTNFMPYLNKVGLLLELNRTEDAIETLDRLHEAVPDFIGTLSKKGFILEKMGQREQAEKLYWQDIAKCDSVIGSASDSVKVRVKNWRAFLTLFIKGKKRGLEEYEKIASEYPENDFVISQREIFYDFDRERYIKEFSK
ncbi:MAG: tetratricopeptide repeat protein [Ignavibacteriae bacterium]|nr:tetratricopeptide repeat protein [Ignavibacteriota bacterium]